jgi:N-acetylmuramoyl-L-alanine amidase
MFNIEWMGDNVKHFESRQGIKPIAICNHISAGTKSSMRNWFNDPASQVSSHFDVGRDGSIWQYVRIEDAAWTQGLSKDMYAVSKAPIVKDMNCNPNLYMVSIEHEGYVIKDDAGNVIEDHGLNGELTEPQFWASCWLHRYIMEYCNNKFGSNTGLGEYNVTGHYLVDPRRKPYCPGDVFPWTRLRAELAVAERMTLNDYQLRVTDILSGTDRKSRAYDVTLRINALWSKVATNDQYAAEALDKLILVETAMKAKDILLP